MTTLADVRGELFDTLDALGVAQVYRHRIADYQYPAYVVGWPQLLDVRPAMGTQRDFVIEVFVAVEVTDDASCDDLLSELLEGAVVAMQENAYWDVQPAVEFEEASVADGRSIITCLLPVAVFA